MSGNGPTIVTSADWHCDSTRVGRWSSQQGIHEDWMESRRQITNVVDTCNEVDADLLIVAGDVFETGRPPAEAVAGLKEALDRLGRTRVIFQAGNHDQQSVLGRHRNPIDAYLSDQSWTYAVQSDPGVIEYDGFYIAGAPWLRVGGLTRLQQTEDNLESEVRRMMDEVGSGPSIFTGHVVVSECTFSSGKRGSEVMMSTSALEASIATSVIDEGPWQVARLGHIHKRQQLSPKTGYVGSIYKVTFGEREEAKGCDVIRWIDGKPELEFREFDVRQLIRVDVSSEGQETPLVATELASKGDIVRFVVDHDGKAEGLGRAVRLLERKGVEVQINNLPKPRSEAVSRKDRLDTDVDPVTALKAYLSRQEIEDTEKDLILKEYGDLTG